MKELSCVDLVFCRSFQLVSMFRFVIYIAVYKLQIPRHILDDLHVLL